MKAAIRSLLFVSCLCKALAHCDDKEPFGDASGFRFEDSTSSDYDPNTDFDFAAFSLEESRVNWTKFGDFVPVESFQDDDVYGVNQCTNLDPDEPGNPVDNIRNPFYFDLYEDPDIFILVDIEVSISNITVTYEFEFNPCEELNATYSGKNCSECASLDGSVEGAGACYTIPVTEVVDIPADSCNKITFNVTGCGGSQDDAINLKQESEDDPEAYRNLDVCTFSVDFTTIFNPCDSPALDLSETYNCTECEALAPNITGAGACRSVTEALTIKLDVNVTVDEIVSAFETQENVTIPGGNENTACCSAERLLPTDEYAKDYIYDESVTVTVKVKPSDLDSDENPENSKRFMELCEELFICSQYQVLENYEDCEVEEVRGCYKYKQRSLCFEDMYNFTSDDTDDRSLLSQFVVDNCWGVSSNRKWGYGAEDGAIYVSPDPDLFPEAEEELTQIEVLMRDLVERVESVCNAATDDSNRRVFVTSDTCADLVDCRNQILLDIDPDSDPQLDPFDACFGLNATELDGELSDCQASGSTDRRERKLSSSSNICPLYLQEYFNPFPPDYPNDANDDPFYESIILDGTGGVSSISDAGGDYKTRTSADTVSYLLTLKAPLQFADLAAEIIGESLPDDEIYVFWKWVPYSVTHPLLTILETEIEAYDFHDGNIDGAETEAAYENSRQLIDGSAAVYDAVRCRKSLDGDILDVKWGQGCDSVDNDCDYVVDECDEDRIPPVIDTTITYAVCGEKWFSSQDDAKTCIETTVTAYDDCDPSVTFSVGSPVADECGITTFTVSAQTSRCVQNTTSEVTVKVADPDANPNTLECSLGGPNGDQDISLASTGASKLEDIELYYNIGGSGNCATGDIQLVAQIYVNEVEDLQSQTMAAFFLYGDPDGKPSAYIAKGLCETSSNGQCIRDPAFPDTKVRLYTFRIGVVDETGRENACEARALVSQDNSVSYSDYEAAGSTQRILLTEYKHTIKEEYETDSSAGTSTASLHLGYSTSKAGEEDANRRLRGR